MTFEQRKRKVIKGIEELKSEELLAQLETIIDSGSDTFESELMELLKLSEESKVLTPHRSTRDLIR